MRIITATKTRRPQPTDYEVRMNASHLDSEHADYDPDAANAFWQAYQESLRPPMTLRWRSNWFLRRSRSRIGEILRARRLRVQPARPF